MPGRIASYIGTFVFLTFGAMISIRPLRNFWLWVLPNPGVMPKRETMEAANWHGVAVGISEETGNAKPVTVRAECTVSLSASICVIIVKKGALQQSGCRHCSISEWACSLWRVTISL